MLIYIYCIDIFIYLYGITTPVTMFNINTPHKIHVQILSQGDINKGEQFNAIIKNRTTGKNKAVTVLVEQVLHFNGLEIFSSRILQMQLAMYHGDTSDTVFNRYELDKRYSIVYLKEVA